MIDERRCKKCGGVGVCQPQHLHHIIPRKEFNLGGTDKDGRIILCVSCHKKLHFLLFKLMEEVCVGKEIEEKKRLVRELTTKWLNHTSNKEECGRQSPHNGSGNESSHSSRDVRSSPKMKEGVMLDYSQPHPHIPFYIQKNLKEGFE